MSLKLWHLIAVVLVILVIMTLGVKNIFVNDANWRTVSAQGLKTKVQTGLTQIFWQWQEDGRPSFISYWPQNTKEPVEIQMSDTGIPRVIANLEGCRDFLTWFVNDLILNKQIKVSTTNVWETSRTAQEHSLAPNELSLSSKGQLQKEFVCRYEYANHVYLYNTKTSKLKTSELE